jgi:hypothetical protein
VNDVLLAAPLQNSAESFSWKGANIKEGNTYELNNIVII